VPFVQSQIVGRNTFARISSSRSSPFFFLAILHPSLNSATACGAPARLTSHRHRTRTLAHQPLLRARSIENPTGEAFTPRARWSPHPTAPGSSVQLPSRSPVRAALQKLCRRLCRRRTRRDRAGVLEDLARDSGCDVGRLLSMTQPLLRARSRPRFIRFHS
jgi:hypothetical protein